MLGHSFPTRRSSDRIYTDLAVIDVTDRGLTVVEMVEGLEFNELQRMTGAPLAIKGIER